MCRSIRKRTARAVRCSSKTRCSKRARPAPFNLAVPSGAEKLYVKYPAASGGEGVVALAVNTANGTDAVDYKFPVDAVKSRYEKVPDYQYYYNSGVIMAEDMWPDFSASDADFNDLVVEYDLKTAEVTSPALLPAHGYKEGLFITLDILRRRQRP